MPITSLSNGESPVFLIGTLPTLKLKSASNNELSTKEEKESKQDDLNNSKQVDLDKSVNNEEQHERPDLSVPSGAVVLKFFSHLQSGRSEDTEIAAHMMFSALAQNKTLEISAKAPLDAAQFIHRHTPTLLAFGKLYDPKYKDTGSIKAHNACSTWPYVLMHYVHGKDLLQTFPAETASQELLELSESALFLGQYMRHLHQFEVPYSTEVLKNPLYEDGWRGFEKWLVKQRRHVTRGREIDPESLPPVLFFKVDEYLSRDVRVLYKWYTQKYNLENPRLLHNDLNEEHLLLIDKKPYCVIDFGDCRVGDPQYEWVAIFISSFRCKKALLKIALLEYFQIKTMEELEIAVGGWPRFTFTMMSYTLLHEQDAIRSAYNRRPELRDVDTLEHLAEMLWNLSVP